MQDLKSFKEEVLQNQALKHDYDKLVPRYAVISKLIAARIKNGVTQKELAKKVGTTQSSIARLEGGNVNPTIDFLEKIAHVLGTKLTIQVG